MSAAATRPPMLEGDGRGATPARPRTPARARLLPYAGLPAVIALACVLNLNRLSQNGYANVFYSAGVQSMLRSLHNFLFASFDPGGLVSVDKPPLALWLQVLSAKLFGFSPLSLLVPEAIVGVLTVVLLYVLLTRRFGLLAAIAGSSALAVFPSFVAVSRDNGVDPLLLLLMTAACAMAVRACESGRMRALIASGVLVGLAFNTKTLAAYLIVPAIAFAYAVCAPVSPRRRILHLLLAGVATLVVSFAWITFVDATPASKRPYVGSSKNNSELGLTFGYNGLGRVEGQEGGPNNVTTRPGGYVPIAHERATDLAARTAQRRGAWPSVPRTPGSHPPAPGPAGPPIKVKGREPTPIPFGPSPNPVRLFGKGLGDQAGWLLPFAVFGLLALAALMLLVPRTSAGDEQSGSGTASAPGMASAPGPGSASLRSRLSSARDDPRLAFTLVFGGWFVIEAGVLSISKGIVHPYYVSALAPPTGAMVGAGAAALATLARSRARGIGLALIACALASTLAVELLLLHRERYMTWAIPVLAGIVAIAFLALLASRRLALPALTLVLGALIATPGAYAATTWLGPVEGTFPVAGPKSFPGPGGYGVDARDLAINRALVNWVSTHHPGSRWALLSVASDTAAPMMLMGLQAGAVGGYSGTDQALSGPGLARLVARDEARYVLLGGGYATRGGNGATHAVLRACRELPAWEWHSPVPFPYGLVLFDCAGRARALAAS